MNQLELLRHDPASLPYPPTLPVELALRQKSPMEICQAYNITQAQWNQLRFDPIFIADLRSAVENLKKDGMSFRTKAKLQSEELLKTSWYLIHSSNEEVPPQVKADLIKFTIRAAGLDGSKDQAAQAAAVSNQLQINLVLG